MLSILDQRLRGEVENNSSSNFNDAGIVKTFFKFICAYFTTLPIMPVNEFSLYAEQVVAAFSDLSEIFSDTRYELTEFLSYFALAGDDYQLMPFIEPYSKNFFHNIVAQLKSKNQKLINSTLCLISSLTGLFDDWFIEAFEDTDLVNASIELLLQRNKTFMKEIFLYMGNIFLSSSSLVDTFVMNTDMMKFIVSLISLNPESEYSPLICLRNLFQNLESRMIEEFVIDNPEVVEFFFLAISTKLGSEAMLRISDIIGSLLLIGENSLEMRGLDENKVKYYVTERTDLLQKLEEAQSHDNESVRKSFRDLVTEFFEYEEYSMGI